MPAQSPLDEIEHDPLPHQLPANRGRYSFSRAIRQVCFPKDVNRRGMSAIDGLEAEVSQEIAHRSGRVPHGFWVPHDAPLEGRALDTTTGAGGIPTILGTVIDVLRAKMACARLGAQTLPDLRGGKFSLPKKTATVSVGWVTEGASPAGGNPVIDEQVPFTPYTTGAYVDISNRLLPSMPSAEAVVIADLMAAIANEVDWAALNAPGSSNHPLGLLQNPAVPLVPIGTDGGAPTRTILCQVEQTVGNANGDSGALGWATTPNGRFKLRNTETSAGSGRYLWSDNLPGPLGYTAVATNQLPSDLAKGSGTDLSPLIFGNWNDLTIALWGAVDILVDPYRLSTSGHTRIRALQDVDVNIRHGESFAKVVDMVTN